MSAIKNKGIYVTLFVMLLWGLLFPMVKLGYAQFQLTTVGDILTFAGVRFTICGAVITAVSYIKNKKDFENLKGNMALVLASGLFAIILHYGFTYTGLNLTDGSKTAIIKQLGAVFYICFAGFFFPNEKLTAKKIFGLLLGIGGIIAINLNATGIAFHLGDLLIIGASFCTVFSNVISKKALQEVNAVVLTGVSQLFGGIVLLIVGMFTGGNVVSAIPKTGSQFLLFAGIVVASVVSYCLWFAVVKKENLSKLFIIKFSEPLFAAVFSWILLGEDIFKMNYLLAFILICMGITVANKN